MLLRELRNLREAANKNEIVTMIDAAIGSTGEVRKSCNYEGAIEAIAAEFRKLDKHDSSKMSDEALYDMIMAQYDEDDHEHNIQMEGVRKPVETVYPGATIYRDKNGKKVGEVYPDGKDWGFHHYGHDNGGDGMDSKDQAVSALQDYHDEWNESKNRPSSKLKEDEDDHSKNIQMEGVKDAGDEDQWFKVSDPKNKIPFDKLVRVQLPDSSIIVAKYENKDNRYSWIRQDKAGRKGRVYPIWWQPFKEGQRHVKENAFDDVEGPDAGTHTTPPPDTAPPAEPRVMAAAGDYKVELDDGEQVHLVNNDGHTVASMPLVIWKQLCRI